jgi:pyridoxamine 5'-phosphate oxidase
MIARERGPGISVRSSIERVAATPRERTPAPCRRRRYARTVDEHELAEDPLEQLAAWYGAAREAGLAQPDAMTVATATAGGRPSARMVLLKGLDEGGVTFFTNRDSRKGDELAENPRAALVLYWQALGRQVRLEGAVEELSREEVEAYWLTRPRGSRIAASASEQSRPIASRAALDNRVADIAARYPEEVPLPRSWSGFRVVPESVELWEHRDDRLHDRVRYDRDGAGWRRQRLQP